MANWLVTGANRGIGLGVSELLLARGDHVFAACRDPEGATGLHGLKARHADRLTLVSLDVTSPDSVTQAAGAVEAPIHVLLNNAGIYGPRDRQGALDMDFDAWEEVLRVNVLAPLRVSQAFLPQVERGRGKIVTISSQMGSLAGSSGGSLAYRSSKAAVNKAMLGLAEAVRPMGIPVAVMHPGWVRTDMGGAGATLSVADSAAGIIRTIDGLDMRRTGSFLNYDGSTIPW